MSFWNTLKQKLRSFIPVSRTYMDNKLRELEKENKRQEKILLELQKNSQSMLELKEYVSQELHRRDDWGKLAAQVKREAKDPLGRLCVCSCLETLSGSNGNVHYN